MALTLVGGGSRSGKSRYALSLAEAAGPRLAYIATAQTLDDEMAARAAAYERERGVRFVTFEEPYDPARVIERRGPLFDAMVVDCATLWLTNLLLDGSRDIDAETRRLAGSGASSLASIIVVSNEVGCGILPETELGRRFRDLAGRANQLLAEAAARVFWMVFGIPVKVK